MLTPAVAVVAMPSCLKFLFIAQASLSEMIPPGCLVMLTPVVVGVLFGTRTLAGVLAGALVSGVQMAVSMSNTGGAWDNAKKYVEVSLCQIFSLLQMGMTCIGCVFVP